MQITSRPICISTWIYHCEILTERQRNQTCASKVAGSWPAASEMLRGHIIALSDSNRRSVGPGAKGLRPYQIGQPPTLFSLVFLTKNNIMVGGVLIRVPDLHNHNFQQQTRVFTISVVYTTWSHDPITFRHLDLFPLPITLWNPRGIENQVWSKIPSTDLSQNRRNWSHTIILTS